MVMSEPHCIYMKAILCFLVVCLVGCSREQPKAERPPFPVTVGDVIQKDVPIYVEAIGNVYSLQSVDVRPQVGGILQEAYVKQGQYVKKGDPLYRIDPRPYEAALNRAQATLEKDKATLHFSEIKAERYKELVKQDYVSKLTYDQYQADVEVAKAQVRSDEADVVTASLQLEWTTPTSPIDGKISQYNIDPGNLVVVNDPTALTNIRQLDPADIRFGIVQKDFLEVQKALHEGLLRFLVVLPQKMDHPREGEIYFIDNHVDTTTGTILIKGMVPNQDELLWPGEFVRVRLQVRLEPQAILVPEEAVQVGQDGPFVFIYDSSTSTVSYRLVTRGATSDRLVIVESGVAVGEKVVLKGQINLRPGAKVALVDQGDGTKEGNL